MPRRARGPDPDDRDARSRDVDKRARATRDDAFDDEASRTKRQKNIPSTISPRSRLLPSAGLTPSPRFGSSVGDGVVAARGVAASSPPRARGRDVRERRRAHERLLPPCSRRLPDAPRLLRRLPRLVPRRATPLGPSQPERAVARGRPRVPRPPVRVQDLPQPLQPHHRPRRADPRDRRQPDVGSHHQPNLHRGLERPRVVERRRAHVGHRPPRRTRQPRLLLARRGRRDPRRSTHRMAPLRRLRPLRRSRRRRRSMDRLRRRRPARARPPGFPRPLPGGARLQWPRPRTSLRGDRVRGSTRGRRPRATPRARRRSRVGGDQRRARERPRHGGDGERTRGVPRRPTLRGELLRGGRERGRRGDGRVAAREGRRGTRDAGDASRGVRPDGVRGGGERVPPERHRVGQGGHPGTFSIPTERTRRARRHRRGRRLGVVRRPIRGVGAVGRRSAGLVRESLGVRRADGRVPGHARVR